MGAFRRALAPVRKEKEATVAEPGMVPPLALSGRMLLLGLAAMAVEYVKRGGVTPRKKGGRPEAVRPFGFEG